ncbi:T9SS type A sorting domain-containing protein [Pinibacter aurantiacus]|uniref:T9SS type A sorting domain-containing protein n=1 Tax=Pinibacter aurantiacus TaxID=2851599 RepID=A0A9E2S7Q4_9BACT|nr:T9SS type A sorting domain-containing protein [Pinibacter aurantiacus]MBV4357756.1 T9SS type A sorting domain-containing protein [Pinibacter aurantiacus]
MKKFLVITFSLLISCLGYSQVTGYSYTIKLGPANNQVSVYAKPVGSGAVKWTQIEAVVGFKTSAGVPAGTWATGVDLNSMFGVGYQTVIDNSGTSISPAGYSYHAYSINLAAGASHTADVTNGTEYLLGTITYGSFGGKSFTPYLLDFADFGSTGDGATYIGDAVNQGPSALYPGMFIPSDIPANAGFYGAVNGGYNNSGSVLEGIGAGNSAATPTISLLPLKLLSFNAKQSNSTGLLDWKVSEQQNTANFIVERSTDGTNYTAIGTIAAAGNYADAKTYSFTDKSPASGLNYYRLKMVDIDGKYTYSPVKTLRFDAIAGGLHILPNPVQSSFYIKGLLEPANVRILDVNGKVVLVQSNVTATTALNAGSLARAAYLVQIIQGNESKAVLKLLKE